MYCRHFTERKASAFAVCTVLALLMLAGCSSGSVASSSSSPSSVQRVASTVTVATATSTSVTTGTSAQATLKHTPTGTANLMWDHTTKMLTVQVTLTGLAPNSVHPSHIHEGSCVRQGKVLYPLSNLVADTHGAAHATTRLSLPSGIPARGIYLNVHNGPGLAPTDQFLPVACSDIVNHDTSLRSNQTVQLTLQSAPESSQNENVSGVTHLSLSGRTLKVQMEISGLQPNSQHAAHIHSGSCASQGPVLYPLETIKANAAGKATITTTIQNVTAIPATGWYVNVHRSTDLSTQTGFDPIACGDVTLNQS